MSAIRKVTAIIVGAGHAGLAMSRCLTEHGIDHVLLERGTVGHSWRTERWDSLRLLTPNWQSRLPGLAYTGSDPDGYRSVAEVIALIEDYARAIAAPVCTGTTVTAVRSTENGYLVRTSRGNWHGRAVVLASGACNHAQVPALNRLVPAGISTLTAQQYRNPGQLADAGVLVVGASASGIQIANEIHRSGRPVLLSVGDHIRAPRLYRDKDIQWWMDQSGILDDRYDTIDDIGRARNVPSLQLAGTVDRSTIDLNALTTIGVRLAGRLVGLVNAKMQFSGSLRNMCALSDLKMGRLLDVIDAWAQQRGLDAMVAPPHRLPPTRVEEKPPLTLDLHAQRIRTIIWCTGYRPDYSWLEVPVLDRKGLVCHDGGITASPGLYLMGTPFMRRRKSSLIDGAADDARELSAHLASFIGARTAERAATAAARSVPCRQPMMI